VAILALVMMLAACGTTGANADPSTGRSNAPRPTCEPVMSPGHNEDRGCADPSPGRPASLGSITGTVRDPDGKPISGAQVSVSGLVHRLVPTLTNAEGAYFIPDVEAGVGSLTAGAPGYTAETRSVTVTSTGQVTVDFVLQPP
jgi:hypothetical protein